MKTFGASKSYPVTFGVRKRHAPLHMVFLRTIDSIPSYPKNHWDLQTDGFGRSKRTLLKTESNSFYSKITGDS